jgi:hypothetical protein
MQYSSSVSNRIKRKKKEEIYAQFVTDVNEHPQIGFYMLEILF